MAIEQQLTDGDKTFIKLVTSGEKKSAAFRQAYPEHVAVVFWGMAKTPEEMQKAREAIKDAAKNKLAAKYINRAMMTYQDKMEQFSALSLETATDLVQNARSEKVRADLAIEGIRHKVGSPTVKVAVQEQKTVYLSFGNPPKDEAQIIEAETISPPAVAEPHAPDETDHS